MPATIAMVNAAPKSVSNAVFVFLTVAQPQGRPASADDWLHIANGVHSGQLPLK